MKRTVTLLLALLLIFGLFGCHYNDGGEILEPVEFFYPRRSDSFVYGTESGVLGSEMREASGRTTDLNYLLSMYLRGPQDNQLRSPFPAGCKLKEIRTGGNTVCLVLSAEFAELESMELTLACAGLTKTCLALTNFERVRIEAVSDSKSFSITLDSGSFLLAENSAFDAQAATEEPS